uniref:SAC3/GANP/THP3 conserved domain-containing protein n=1 Tax=Nelumbo nucifera TaxID=4432 RepID=A0A822ZD06_NELNU|nr:TPA_asm: hypothetical protein HUJ06_001252 [Nelumbo nucifera]
MEKGRREAKKPNYSSSSPDEQRRLRSNNFHSNRSENNAQVSKRGSTCSSNTLDENYGQSQDSSNLPSLVGTCLDMCPARERAQRERLRDLSVFERLNGNPGRTSPSLAVKKFCRTMSTTHIQASDVRPLPVLQGTLDYLLSLLDSSEHPFDVVHDFVFDRTRSIRQDLSMQNIVNDQAINMYEEMVKFHIISHHKLLRCSSNPNISSAHYLNMEQLTKSLLSLYDLYNANRKFNSINRNEAEFLSFYVLLHLGFNGESMGESLSTWFRLQPSSVTKSKEMRFARKVLRFFRVGNYKCFFSTIASEASYLQFCLMEPFINEVVLDKCVGCFAKKKTFYVPVP